MEIKDIEQKIACGEMSAAQVFTQMRQHTIGTSAVTFKNWFSRGDHDFVNYPEDAMADTWNAAIDSAVVNITSCKIVDPDILRVRLHEAVGSVLELKVKRT